MGDHHYHHQMMPSWGCTLITQAALCLSLYVAFNIGSPQTLNSKNKNNRLGRESLDLYFLSVRGGLWPLKQQTQLLQQMENAAKIYKAEFVVNISELGEDDPLMQNATLHFPLLKIPWYTTTASHGQEMGNFLKKIKIPHEQILDIIGLDTGPFQDLLHAEKLTETGSNQLLWIQRALAETDSNWRIVVGFDPLMVCQVEHTTVAPKYYVPLHHIFLKHGVNAYLSKQGCNGHHYHDGGTVYIGNPVHINEEHMDRPINGSLAVISQMRNRFLIHRVSPLEIESHLINSAGEVVSSYTLHQWGREIM